MSSQCEAFEAALTRRMERPSPGDAAGAREISGGMPEELAAHGETCPRCREILAVHEALGTVFDGRPVPGLSMGFEARLGRRLAAEAGRGSRWLRWLLPAYWAAAAVAGMVVLRTIGLPSVDAPEALGPAVWFVLLTLSGLALPACALLRAWLRVPLPPLPK